jgi:anti-sigma factor RsiW
MNGNMEDQELSQALKTRASYHAAPAALRAQLQDDLRAAAAPQPARTRSTGDAGGWNWLTGKWLTVGAAFALGILLTLGLVGLAGNAPGAGSLENQIVAGHVRSLMASHLTDVASTDQHTVKPWFNGKVDFSPPVNDLVAEGFPLTGGRLDYLGGHQVAALVYKRRAHPINLFIWPESGAEQALAAGSEQGYHVLQWRHAGMRYAAVSDVSADELKAFAENVQRQTGS